MMSWQASEIQYLREAKRDIDIKAEKLREEVEQLKKENQVLRCEKAFIAARLDKSRKNAVEFLEGLVCDMTVQHAIENRTLVQKDFNTMLEAPIADLEKLTVVKGGKDAS